MLDYLSCTAELTFDETRNTLGSDAFSQWDGSLDKHGRAVVRTRNLTWSLHVQKGRLRIYGSLPSFANGDNLQLLTYPETKVATDALAGSVMLPAERLILKGLELSADVTLPTSPRPFLESLAHHRQSVFYPTAPPKGVARPLEYNAHHGDYRVKYYDKGAWSALQGNTLPAGQHKLRYEVVCTRARPINALLNQSQVTLADIATPSFYLAAANELRKHWAVTVRRPPLDFKGLKFNDSTLLQVGASPEFWRGLKHNTPDVTIKRKKAQYKQLAAAARERSGADIYNLRFPTAIEEMLATLPQVENDTILHTCYQVELPSIESESKTQALTVQVREIALSESAACGDALEVSGQVECEKTERKTKRKTDKKQPASPPQACQTCGRPLSGLNPKAKFCSERELGPAAKKCRNKASNPRNNARRRLLKIESEPLLFDVRPFVQVPDTIRGFVLTPAA